MKYPKNLKIDHILASLSSQAAEIKHLFLDFGLSINS